MPAPAPSGSLPYIQSAPRTWSTASRSANVVSHALRCSVDEKNQLIVVSDAGSCSRPYTPAATATSAPMRIAPAERHQWRAGDRR